MERVLHPIRRDVVIDAHPQPHGVDLGRVMEVDDRVARDLVVRDVEINAVVGPEPGRAPVDLHHFGVALLDVEPVADLVGLADLERDAGDDAAE